MSAQQTMTSWNGDGEKNATETKRLMFETNYKQTKFRA